MGKFRSTNDALKSHVYFFSLMAVQEFKQFMAFQKPIQMSELNFEIFQDMIFEGECNKH